MAVFKYDSFMHLNEIIFELKDDKIVVFSSTTSMFKNAYNKIKTSVKPTVLQGFVMHPTEGPTYFLYDSKKYYHAEASTIVLNDLV